MELLVLALLGLALALGWNPASTGRYRAALALTALAVALGLYGTHLRLSSLVDVLPALPEGEQQTAAKQGYSWARLPSIVGLMGGVLTFAVTIARRPAPAPDETGPAHLPLED